MFLAIMTLNLRHRRKAKTAAGVVEDGGGEDAAVACQNPSLPTGRSRLAQQQLQALPPRRDRDINQSFFLGNRSRSTAI